MDKAGCVDEAGGDDHGGDVSEDVVVGNGVDKLDRQADDVHPLKACSQQEKTPRDTTEEKDNLNNDDLTCIAKKRIIVWIISIAMTTESEKIAFDKMLYIFTLQTAELQSGTNSDKD